MAPLNRGPVVIRLELETLRHQVSQMLSDQALDIDNQIKAALDEFCKEDHLGSHIREVTRKVTEQAVQSAVENFFRYGAGFQAIEAAVTERLNADLAKLVKESRL